MATKIVRRTLLQFGITANPASEIGQFGSFTSPDFSLDVGVMQSGTAWPRGWFGSVANTNRQFIQDQNAIDFVFGYMLSYILQMGVAEYDSGTYYFLNSICQIAGQFYTSLQDSNNGNAPASSPTAWQPGIPGTEISGVVKAYAGIVAPTGYLLCQGQAVSRTTYAALFAVCGVAYGSGDGSTTFNIPDLRTRIPVGFMTGDANFGTVGGVGGEEAHTLVLNEIPSHSHLNQNGNGSFASGGNTDALVSDRSGSPNQPTSAVGGGASHNNIQPFVTMNYIIKT